MRRPPSAAAVALLAAAGLAGCAEAGGAPAEPAPTPAFTALETAPEPVPAAGGAAAAAKRRVRSGPRHLVARVRRETALRARPGGRVLARAGRRTEFGSRTTLAVTRRAGGWVQVISPLLDNDRRGWVRERDVALRGTDVDIRIDRSRRRAVVRRDGRRVMAFTVAVGRPGNETPLGRFAVTDKLRPEDPTSPYGCCAVALSGHQTRLEPGWPGGDRLAIHGTPATWSVGEAVSLGCLRAHRRPLERLMRKVPLGAPVRIVR